MSFLFPSLLLIGLPLAAAPIVLHLLNLRRQTPVAWAAMEYLLESEQKSRTWINLKEWLLLAARVLAVLLAVLMLAQPRLGGGLAAWLAMDRAHYVVVLDDSYSMADRGGPTPLWDEALAAFDEVAEAVEKNAAHKLSVLRTSELVFNPSAQPTTAGDRSAVFAMRKRVAGLGPSQTAGGLQAAIATTARFAQQQRDDGQLVVYVISDFRRRDVEPADSLDAAMAELATSCSAVHLAACSTKRQENVAVTDLRLLPGSRVAGIEQTAEVTIRNFGQRDSAEVTVRLTRDDEPLPAVAIERLPARESVTKSFPVRFDTVGDHRLEAAIDADSVVTDNRRYFATSLPESREVLVVDGSSGGSEGRAFVAALRPSNTRGPIATGWRPRRVTPADLASVDLGEVAAVLLLDVPRLPPPAANALKRYVAGGGGLFLALGPSVDRDSYNRLLFAGDRALAPLQLDLPTQHEPAASGDVGDVMVTDHPLFRVFSGDRNSFLQLLAVNYYHSLKAPDDLGEAQAIASLSGGAPLLIEHQATGSVMVMLTTVGRPPGELEGWSNLGRSPVFPVIVNELVAHLAAPGIQEPTPVVGQPWAKVAWPESVTRPQKFVAESNGQAATESRSELAPAVAGWWTAQAADTADADRLLAVNVDPSEGDLAAPSVSQLRDLFAGSGVSVASVSEFFRRDSASSTATIYRFLGIVLLLLLVAEQSLAVAASYHQTPRAVGEVAR